MEAIEHVSQQAEEKKAEIKSTINASGTLGIMLNTVAMKPTDRPSVQASAVHVIQK